jgi:hypothetical protein
LLIRGDVLDDGLCLAVLRDDQRLALLREFPDDLDRIGLKEADGFDLG